MWVVSRKNKIIPPTDYVDRYVKKGKHHQFGSCATETKMGNSMFCFALESQFPVGEKESDFLMTSPCN